MTDAAVECRNQAAMVEHEQLPDIRLEFFSRPAFLGVIRRMLDTLCERLGLSSHESARICLAIDEAIANVIRHGYQNDPDGRIELTVTRIESPEPELVIEILDRADTVDIDTIRSRNLDDIRPGGLGVHIITEIMQGVEYSHREGGGMCLRMRHPLGQNSTVGRSSSDG
ncbi:MAG: ATP-binding protein [Phycisphaerales bacterium]|nr:ATP-binding protein [Phycisphaerales bacterium]MCH2154255.1 ATP-binding protein [Phycisphaerales bacterium]